MAQTRMPRILMMVAMLVIAAPAVHAQTTATSIHLTWTAPGDDGAIGTATQYDLRYSTATITAGNFGSATQWNTTPTPAVAGTSQTTTLTGLTPATTYYFAIKAVDNAGNWGTISNVVSKATLAAPDVTPPAALAVNMGTVTDTTAVMNWTSTGDDSLTGTASSYDVRYSSSPITLANWNAATQATGEPVPAVAGTSQAYTVRNLTREGTYYFAIRAADETGNVSGLSNVPQVTTPDTRAPASILNLTANFLWLSWHSASAMRPRMTEAR